jgi:hypothetical protein
VAKQTPSTPWFGVPNNRQEALRIGHPHYFTGKPCIHGHLSNRDAKDRKCLGCELVFVRNRVKNPEYKSKFLAWSRANKDTRRAASNKSKQKNPERVRAWMRDWWERNKEAQAEKRAAWSAANKPKIYAANAARRALEILATPPWASQYQEEFEAIYAERLRIDRETGIKHHVDHIYPLKGKNSCGLHVPWNLRVIPARENMQKRNHPPVNIIMSLTESGWRYLGAVSRSSVAVVDTSIKLTSESSKGNFSLSP